MTVTRGGHAVSRQRKSIQAVADPHTPGACTVAGIPGGTASRIPAIAVAKE
jgi:hypothetical protein